MANFNKVVLIGRLTRDPECRSFPSGGMVSKFGFAVTNRRKNSQTGQWEDEPMFIDCEVYNRGEYGKLADLVRDRCRRGSQIMIEGRLHLDQWEDKTTGQKRSKHKIVVESLQLLEGRANDASQNLAAHDEFPPSSTRGMAASERDSRYRGHSAQQRGELADASETDSPNPSDDDIPF